MARDYRHPLLADLETVEIRSTDRLGAGPKRSKSVYFPTGAVISAVCHSRGQETDVRGVGREGMIGADILCGIEIRPFDYRCQIGGTMLRMPAIAFTRYLTKHRDLRRILSTYSDSVLAVTARSVACNSMHTIGQRCARWLLVTSDRVKSRDFLLTHGLLARMLGVERSGVSLAVSKLQRLGSITYRMGRVSVLNAKSLESKSCDCYRAAVRENASLWRDSKRSARAAQ